MRKNLTRIAMTSALALSVCASAAFAAPRKAKHSAEHTAAIKKCNDDYRAALKEAKTKKGNERKSAEAAARQAHKQCIANAPK